MKLRDGILYSDFYLSNGKRVRKALGTNAKAEAKKLEKELQARLEAELQGLQPPIKKPPLGGFFSGKTEAHKRPPCGITLGKAFRNAMREREEWRASSAQATINGNYKALAEEFGEATDLSYFDRQVMRKYADKLAGQKKSNSTINQRLSVISVLLKLAEDWTEGAIEPFKMPRRKPGKARIRVVSRDEEAKALKWCMASPNPRAKDFHDLIITLVDTGLRLSEAINIRSSETDWDNGKVAAWRVKGNYAPRLVPMTQRVRKILESRKELEQPFGIFTVDSADVLWNALRKDIGINTKSDPEFVLHALRHTCASRLAASGMDAFRIQKWMGHKNIQTTMIYVTLFAADLDGLADALDQGNQKAAKGPQLGENP